MRQQAFATGDFERYRKATCREQFLAEINPDGRLLGDDPPLR